MSARKVITIRQCDFPSRITDSTFWQSRAAALIESGMIDRANEITELSHHLTDSVMATLSASEHDIVVGDYRPLRCAIWEGIATGILQRRLGKSANDDITARSRQAVFSNISDLT